MEPTPPPRLAEQVRRLLTVRTRATANTFMQNVHLVGQQHRTAYLVDGTAAGQRSIADAVRRSAAWFQPFSEMAVMSAFGQLFVLCPRRLRSRYNDCRPTLLGGVGAVPVWACDSRTQVPGWPSAPDALEWQHRLVQDVGAILDAYEAARSRSIEPSGADGEMRVVTFDACESRSCPVALTGFLLEYPVVYDTRGPTTVQTRDTSENYLSGTELTLFSMRWTWWQDGDDAMTRNNSRQCRDENCTIDNSTSVSFSVPSSLLSSDCVARNCDGSCCATSSSSSGVHYDTDTHSNNTVLASASHSLTSGEPSGSTLTESAIAFTSTFRRECANNATSNLCRECAQNSCHRCYLSYLAWRGIYLWKMGLCATPPLSTSDFRVLQLAQVGRSLLSIIEEELALTASTAVTSISAAVAAAGGDVCATVDRNGADSRGDLDAQYVNPVLSTVPRVVMHSVSQSTVSLAAVAL